MYVYIYICIYIYVYIYIYISSSIRDETSTTPEGRHDKLERPPLPVFSPSPTKIWLPTKLCPPEYQVLFKFRIWIALEHFNWLAQAPKFTYYSVHYAEHFLWLCKLYGSGLCSMGVRYYSTIATFVDGGRVRDYYAGDERILGAKIQSYWLIGW